MTELALSPPPDIIQVDEKGELHLVHSGQSREEIRAQIMAVKDHLLALTEGERMELPVEHEFVDGMYVRRLFIPAGTIVVGKIHKKACFNVVERGEISVLTEHGSRRLEAGFTGISMPGIQKLGFAHTDTVFVNIFRTDITDIETIEQDIACESYDLLQLDLRDGQERIAQ